MPLVRAFVGDGGVSPDHPVVPGELIAQAENILAGALATAGDGTWTGAIMATGIIRRTGPVGAYTDTTDTATNILLALAGNFQAADIVPGVSFRLLFQNTVAQAMTLAAGVGVTLGTGTTTTAASLVREYLITILNATPAVILNCATTNGNKVITFNLQPNQTSLPLGSVTPGMVISGTGITAGTKVVGVTQGIGGMTGVTTDTNSTATNNPVALTFGPSVQIDSLRSSTL